MDSSDLHDTIVSVDHESEEELFGNLEEMYLTSGLSLRETCREEAAVEDECRIGNLFFRA